MILLNPEDMVTKRLISEPRPFGNRFITSVTSGILFLNGE